MSAVMVAIAGGSGSGKTTLAAKLAAELSDLHAVVLAQDRYFRDFAEYEPEARAHVLTANRPDAVNWDAFHEALGRLMAGGTVREPAPGTQACARGVQATSLGPAGVVIVEGLFTLWDERCRELGYLRLYTEVDEDERVLRRLERDVATRGTTLPEAVAWYRRDVAPNYRRYTLASRCHAHLVVPMAEDDVVRYLAIADAVRSEWSRRNSCAHTRDQAGPH